MNVRSSTLAKLKIPTNAIATSTTSSKKRNNDKNELMLVIALHKILQTVMEMRVLNTSMYAKHSMSRVYSIVASNFHTFKEYNKLPCSGTNDFFSIHTFFKYYKYSERYVYRVSYGLACLHAVSYSSLE